MAQFLKVSASRSPSDLEEENIQVRVVGKPSSFIPPLRSKTELPALSMKLKVMSIIFVDEAPNGVLAVGGTRGSNVFVRPVYR